LYFLIATTISLLGAAVSFSSGSGGHGSNIMNRTVESPLVKVRAGFKQRSIPALYPHDELQRLKSTAQATS
jgi:hypothetical protein